MGRETRLQRGARRALVFSAGDLCLSWLADSAWQGARYRLGQGKKRMLLGGKGFSGGGCRYLRGRARGGSKKSGGEKSLGNLSAGGPGERGVSRGSLRHGPELQFPYALPGPKNPEGVKARGVCYFRDLSHRPAASPPSAKSRLSPGPQRVARSVPRFSRAPLPRRKVFRERRGGVPRGIVRTEGEVGSRASDP